MRPTRAVALIPERRAAFAGWERADSIVVNPHKWLFVPLDASLLVTQRMDALHQAFSLRPEYLRTLDRTQPVRDYNEYQPQLGRRFRALKLWIHLRWFGIDGLRQRIEAHIAMAQRFAAWVDDGPDWERLAPVPFGTVCFRYRPAASPDRRRAGDPGPPRSRERGPHGRRQRDRRGFLSHTRLRDGFTIRLAIGNLRTEDRHVERAWELLRREAARIHV